MSKEAVNHPQHYGGENNQYEAIKVIEAWELDFCLGNTVKYISRAGKKDNVVQDLKKAKWYLSFCDKCRREKELEALERLPVILESLSLNSQHNIKYEKIRQHIRIRKLL